MGFDRCYCVTVLLPKMTELHHVSVGGDVPRRAKNKKNVAVGSIDDFQVVSVYPYKSCVWGLKS